MIYWIWLTQIPFIGPVTARYLIKELGDAEKIYQADYKTLSKMSGLAARQKESIIRNHSLEKAKRILDDCQNKNISILCWNDECYPLRAREPADAPPMLYYKGNGSDSWNSRSKKMQPGSKTENGISGIGICKDPDCSCQRNGQRNRQLCTYCMSQRRWIYNSDIRKWSGYLLSK